MESTLLEAIRKFAPRVKQEEMDVEPGREVGR
jgi:hypothetical protein